jgi:hypothetical protein
MIAGMTWFDSRSDRALVHASALAGLRRMRGWELHPGVRSGDRLSRGERAADLARDRLGSWVVTLAGAAVAGWGVALIGQAGRAVVVGMMLCGQLLTGLSLLLMAMRRADRTASELALYELESDQRAAAAVAELRDEVDRLRGELAGLTARLQRSGQAGDPG